MRNEQQLKYVLNILFEIMFTTITFKLQTELRSKETFYSSKLFFFFINVNHLLTIENLLE